MSIILNYSGDKLFFPYKDSQKEITNPTEFICNGKPLPFRTLGNTACDFFVEGSFNQQEYLSAKNALVVEMVDEVKKEKKISKPKIKIIKINNNEYTRGSQQQNIIAKLTGASSPYNFVPLNEIIVHGQALDDRKTHNIFHDNLNHGYIDVELENETALFIRGNGSDFLKRNGNILIPGSSFRGMIRTLIEIVSWGKISYEDKRFAYRTFARDDPFGYKENFIQKDGDEVTSLAKAGWFEKNGNKYNLYRCIENEVIYDDGTRQALQFLRVNGICKEKKFILNGNDIVLYKKKRIYYKKSGVKKLHVKRINTRQGQVININLRYNVVEKTNDAITVDCTQIGFLYATGFMQGKHYQYILNPPEKKAISIDDIIADYKQDENKEIDLLKLADEAKEKIPCFYLTDKDDNIIAVGPTPNFRMPYKNKISHFADQNNEGGKPDFAECVFGTTKKSTKVFFEDFESQGAYEQYEESIHKPLQSPRASTIQHYLRPKGGSQVKHYNSNKNSAVISGYKLYYHKKNTDDWRETKEDAQANVGIYGGLIKPVKKGCRFIGRIRFENLSDEELGVLLFVLELPNNTYHKIGLGKPLGLGTVKVKKCNLSLTNKRKENRYVSFIKSENNLFSFATGKKEGDKTYFKNKFEEYILPKINEIGVLKLSDTDRLKQLQTILNWENTKAKNWEDCTRYLEIDRIQTDHNGELIYKTDQNGNILRKDGVPIPETKNEFSERKQLLKPTESIIIHRLRA